MADDEAEVDWRRYDADKVCREAINRQERERLRAWVGISPAVLEELKATRLKPEPQQQPQPDWRRYDANEVYREQVNEQERERRGLPVIEITRAELENVKA